MFNRFRFEVAARRRKLNVEPSDDSDDDSSSSESSTANFWTTTEARDALLFRVLVPSPLPLPEEWGGDEDAVVAAWDRMTAGETLVEGGVLGCSGRRWRCGCGGVAMVLEVADSWEERRGGGGGGGEEEACNGE